MSKCERCEGYGHWFTKRFVSIPGMRREEVEALEPEVVDNICPACGGSGVALASGEEE